MDGHKIAINVSIGGLSLPMTTTSEEQEALIRRAANNVNRQLITVREKYKSISNEKYYAAMVMLNSEVKALSAENKSDSSPIFEILDDLEKEIDELIIRK